MKMLFVGDLSSLFSKLKSVQVFSSSMCEADEALLIVSHEKFERILKSQGEEQVTQNDADQWGYGGVNEENW